MSDSGAGAHPAPDLSAQDASRLPPELIRPEAAVDPLAAAVRNTRRPMVVTNPRQLDNPIVFVNEAFVQLTGYPRPEAVGRNPRFLQGPETDPDAVARMRMAIAAGEPLEIDIRNHRKDGTAFWNRVLLEPLHDDAGEIAYFFASQFDVTLEREQLGNLEAQNDQLTTELSGQLRALQESEGRFLQMANHVPVMIWMTEASGPRAWSGQSWFEFTGQQSSQSATDSWLQVVHPLDREASAVTFREATAALRPFRMEYRLRRADGSYAWVLDTATPRLTGRGTSLGYVGSVLDITDRREAQERLELSEQSLRLATEAAEIGTWEVDVATGVFNWSDRTKIMFGISPVLRRPLDEFFAYLHPDDVEATRTAFRSAVDPAVRATYDVEYRIPGVEDGDVRWIAAKGKGVFDEAGRCTRAVGTAIDITARKAAETRRATLLDLADRLRAPSDAATKASAAIDVLAAQFGLSRVGYAQIEVLGPSCLDNLRQGRVLVQDDVLAGPVTDQVAWQAMGIRAVTIVPLIRDGRLSASFYVGHRQPHRWLPEDVQLIEQVAAQVWNAAERARAEEALHQLNATLEARVEERTAELRHAEAALRQSQKMEAVGQLTGGIAHDFNNLLTGIAGALEMLQRRVTEGRISDLQRYADVATDSANRAAALTQRLLAFARRQPLDPRQVEINRLMAGMEDLLRRTLGPLVELEILPGDGLWPTMCDPHQLESSVLNLAINARDAMPNGGRLTIETANAHLDETYARAQGGEVKPGHYVSVLVTDTGCGMSADVAAHAFEPFFTTKPLGQGTGLGLSQLYGFVKQSEGHVRAYSEVGLGTTFRIYLPRHSGTELPSDPSPERAASGDGTGTILVVEDEQPVRRLMAEILEELGYTVIEAADGPAGLRVVQSAIEVDLLVTDVGLPGLNGRQLADAARTVRPELKVLFITGFAGNAAIGNGVLEAGMKILTKPFAMAALADKVQSLVAER